MRLSKLRRKLVKQAKSEFKAGRLHERDYKICLALADNKEGLEKFNERIEKDVNPWNRADGLIGMDWKEWLQNIWDWFVANWPAILNIIVTIAPLLLLEPSNEDR